MEKKVIRKIKYKLEKMQGGNRKMKELAHLKSKLLAEEVEEQIFQYIVKKNMRVGEKLPSEFELCRQYGVSRSTIREAVKALIGKGILEVRRGSGTYVIGTVPLEEDPFGIRDMPDKEAIAMDLVEVRLMIEPAMAEMAALRASKEEVERLRMLCERVEQKIKNEENYIKDDIAFHCCVAECSHNKIVEQIIPIIDTAVMMFVNITHKKLMPETIRTHKAVVDAIAEGDSQGARLAMTMHLTYNRDMIKNIRQV